MKAAQAARKLLPGDSAYGDALSIGDGQRPGELFARYLSEVSEKPMQEESFEVSRKRWFRAKGAPKDLQVFSVKPRAAA